MKNDGVRRIGMKHASLTKAGLLWVALGAMVWVSVDGVIDVDSVSAQETDETEFSSWVYACVKVPTPPKIDGLLDDAVYRRAPVAGGFIDYHNPWKYVQPTTTFQIVHHGNSLYFAVRCEEPELEKIEPRPAKDRDAVLAIGETVELFIDPQHDHDDYYQWIPSIHGDLYDAHRSDLTWDSEVNFATARGDGFWSIEFELPLSQIGLDRLKQWQVMGVRVCRNRWLKSSKYWSSWSFGGFHEPAGYDHLVICDESGEIPEEKLSELMPIFRDTIKKKNGPVLIARSTGTSGESFSSLGEVAVRRAERRLAELEAMAAILQRRADELRGRLSTLRDQTPTLGPGTYPVFVLGTDALVRDVESSYWASRKEALLAILGEADGKK